MTGPEVPDAEVIDGAELLDEVRAAYTRYVVFPSPEDADAAALYTAATHGQPVWEHATRLVVKSPIKRCGKTRLQEVARELVHHALPSTNISAAALARSINEHDPPTLILDEADTVWGKKDQRSEAPKTYAASSTQGTPAAGPTSGGTQRPDSVRIARRSPWRSSGVSGTCPTPSRTAPSSSVCAAAPLTSRSANGAAATPYRS